MFYSLSLYTIGRKAILDKYMPTEFILTISVLIQFATAFISAKLIRVTGKRVSWGLISLAISFMAIRRSISLFHFMSGDNRSSLDSSFELVGLITSVLMLTGVILISPLFKSMANEIAQRKQAEEELQESEMRYRSLFENMIEGYAYCRMLFDDSRPQDFIYLHVNSSFERLTGLKNVVGKRVTEVIPGIRESHPELFEIYGRVILTGKPERFESYSEFFGGWLAVTVCRTESECFVAVFDNITERKKTEEALRKREEHWRLLFHRSPIGIFHYNTELRITDCNDRFTELLQSSHEKLMGLDMKTLRDQSVLPAVRKAITGNEGLYEGFYRATTSRAEIWVSMRTAPIFDQNGKVEGGVGIVEDITDRKRAEGKLHLFRNLLDRSSDAIFVSDPETSSILDVNEKACESLGYSREELLRMKVIDIEELMKGDPSLWKAHIEKRKKEGGYSRFEGRHIRKDRSMFPVEVSGNYVVSEQGDYVLSVVRDITERKHVEEKLKETSQRLQSLINASPLAITVLDRDGIVTMWNPAAERIFGWSEEEVLGRILPTVPEDRKEEFRVFRERVQKGESFMGVEIRRLKKDGSQIDINLSTAPFRDFKGDVIGLVGIMADITHSKKTEEALRTSEETFRSVVDNVAIGISLISPDMEIVALNRQMREWFPEIEVEKKPVCYMAFNNPPRKDICSYCVTCETLIDGKVHETITETPIDDKIVNFRVVSSPIRDINGNVIAAIEMVEDITERKNMEDSIKASLREKEVLLKEIHHRVKNNLQVISSMLNLQSAYVKDKQALDLFTESRNRVKSMALIHEKLYQSKDLARIDFGDYVRTLAEDLFHSYRMGPADIKLTIDIEDVLLDIDKALSCGLIINELVSNSLKYAFPPDTAGQISISLHSDADGIFTLIVSDNGKGVPENIDFRYVKSLGLQLVSLLTEQLDGAIEVEGKGGTSFTISFKGQKTPEG
jgi:PAS domain S-box-containing protein